MARICIVDGIAKSTPHHPPLKIIMVDDDKEDQLLFAAAVHNADPSHIITFVSNGEELLNILHDFLKDPVPLQDFPDVIFMDLDMPKKEGLKR